METKTETKPQVGDVVTGTYCGVDFIGRLMYVGGYSKFGCVCSVELDGPTMVLGEPRTEVLPNYSELTLVDACGLESECTAYGWFLVDRTPAALAARDASK